MLCIKQCSALAVALAVEKPDACLLGSYQGPPVLLKEAPEVAPRFLDIQNGPVPHNIKSQWTPLSLLQMDTTRCISVVLYISCSMFV